MKRPLPPRTTQVLALFVGHDDEHEQDEPRARRASSASMRLDSKLPDRRVHLDFEIRGRLPNAHEEWQARSDWLGYLRTHAKALAALAVDRTEGETRERTILVAERLGTLLKQGTTMTHSSVDRLDLAAPLPQMTSWPPVFAGEPLAFGVESIMKSPLDWHDLDAVAGWARQIAYFVSGLHGNPPQAVRQLAIVRLRRLIDAAARGLVTGRCFHPEERDAPTRAPTAAAPTRAPRKRPAKKGGAT